MAAFYTDMGSRMANITLLVMTEFGRRVAKNSSNGVGTFEINEGDFGILTCEFDKSDDDVIECAASDGSTSVEIGFER